MVDLDLLIDLMRIDSSSSAEGALADWLCTLLVREGWDVVRIPSPDPGDTRFNILVSVGTPKVVFCTHLDTVPPYIPPTLETAPDGDTIIRGRGACDAKGQIVSMLSACRELRRRGCSGFALLLLYGEETGSFGAKAVRDLISAPYLVVGEPTDNKMAVAAKGTKAFRLTIRGTSFHSGYPEYGESAIDTFVDIVNRLRATDFGIDPDLGDTTFNIGRLSSDNPQNVLSPLLRCTIYFRTTFVSDARVCGFMESLCSDRIEIEALGGDSPTRFLTFDGMPECTVAFGSDAPQLTGFSHKILCGPGSILVAHRPDEHVRLSELIAATDNYIDIYSRLADIL